MSATSRLAADEKPPCATPIANPLRSVNRSLLQLKKTRSLPLKKPAWNLPQADGSTREETAAAAAIAVPPTIRSGATADNNKSSSRKANKRHKGVVQKMKRKFHLPCFPPSSPLHPRLFQKLLAVTKIKSLW